MSRFLPSCFVLRSLAYFFPIGIFHFIACVCSPRYHQESTSEIKICKKRFINPNDDMGGQGGPRESSASICGPDGPRDSSASICGPDGPRDSSASIAPMSPTSLTSPTSPTSPSSPASSVGSVSSAYLYSPDRAGSQDWHDEHKSPTDADPR